MSRGPLEGRAFALCLAIALFGAVLAGCTTGPAPVQPNGTDGEEPNQTPPNGTDQTPPPSEDTLPLGDLPTPDQDRLMHLVERQIFVNGTDEVRYRVPGEPGHEAAIPILADMLEDANLTVTQERYQDTLPGGIGRVNLTNLYGVRPGTDPGAGEIWLAAHWDSRAWADAHREACTGPPVQGANDGAAAVAVVVHALELIPETNRTVRVALFDAEDQGCRGSGWALGSEHAAKTREANGTLDAITALVLVDMPGDEDLMIRREGASQANAPRLTDLAFRVAEETGSSAFLDESGPSVIDDHIPFLDRGVPAVDLIHLDKDDRRWAFPWTHHTEHDTVENLDPANMAQVTRVAVGTALAIDRGAYPGEAS